MKLNIHVTTYAKIGDIVQSVGMSTLYCSKHHYSLCPRYMNVLLLLFYY